MGSTLLSLLKELNGYKYVLAIAVAVFGSWYDIKGEVAELRHGATAIKDINQSRHESQLARDRAQEEAIKSLHDDLIAEIRLIRQELIGKK